MIHSAAWWLFFNLLSIVFLAFYSMMEMACVSFNKVRLHYYVQKGKQRAKWLNYLLQHPFRLFGTTLIGVNVAMVAGSECAREFHSAIGLNPALAPLSQVIIVVIFGELAPMFAARHYAEHVAILGVPLVYASARILTPVLWVIGWISKATNFLIKGKTEQPSIFLSQEELQKILEEHEEEPSTGLNTQELNLITQNIFHLRHKGANQLMTSIEVFPRLPSNATVVQMKNFIKRTNANFVMVYYKEITNIVGIAFPRDLVRAHDTKRIRDFTRPPWFITKNTKLTQILHQFQRNSQTVAVILDRKGKAMGLITLNDLLSTIFGEARYRQQKQKNLLIIERTFPGDMLVGEFNREFEVVLDPSEGLTLSELMEKVLGHHPEEKESIFIEPFELIAKETSILEVKYIEVKTHT